MLMTRRTARLWCVSMLLLWCLTACVEQRTRHAATVAQPNTGPASETVRQVAITFDDLPFATASNTADSATRQAARAADAAVRASLNRHAVPATGFVNEATAQGLGSTGQDILRRWNRGRLALGNHGYAHADSNDLTLEQIEADIVSGEASIRRLAQSAGRTIPFFRFPYNHIGQTAEKQRAIEQLLTRHGYRLAASTIDTSDHVFNRAYEHALVQRDRTMQRRIKAAYLAHTRTQIVYYANLNRQALGYEPPAIMLLHLNRLNGDVMQDILAVFRDLQYRFVTLEDAQSDPAYARPPTRPTQYGPMWGYRWARDRNVRVDGRLEQEPPAWVSAYGAD